MSSLVVVKLTQVLETTHITKDGKTTLCGLPITDDHTVVDQNHHSCFRCLVNEFNRGGTQNDPA